MKRLALALSLLIPSFCFAHATPAPVSNANFESLKKLAGEWEGQSQEGNVTQNVKATYEVTSGGSAVVERIFVGTPQEMTTVYYTNGKDVRMAHYCMLGNQPIMKLKSSTDKAMTFELEGTQGLQSKNEEHMHALTLTWNGDNNLVQNWMLYINGKQEGVTSISFNKKTDLGLENTPKATKSSTTTTTDKK